MQLNNKTVVSMIDIWAPRWNDRVVLIAKYKVGEHNAVIFSRTPSMSDEYYLSGDTIRKYPLVNNGKIKCYAVHMDELEKLQRVGEEFK